MANVLMGERGGAGCKREEIVCEDGLNMFGGLLILQDKNGVY